MTTKKTSVQEFDDLFDNYDEQASIQSFSASLKPRVIIVEGNALAKFPDDKIFKLPLTISLQSAEMLQKTDGDDPVEQMRQLFIKLCGESETDQLMEEPYQSLSAFAQKYFELFEKVSKATMGEYMASSH